MHERGLAALLIGAGLLWLLFFGLERLSSNSERQRRSRGQWRTDMLYWLFTPTVSRSLSRSMILFVVGAIALCWPWRDPAVPLVQTFAAASPLARQPQWLQALEVIVIGDLCGYFIHRAKHESAAWWRIHVVHHSAKALDWLAATRLHPLDDALGTMARTLPIFLLGFDPAAFVGALAGLGIFGLLLHANVRWTFGPLRYVIASPTFHRWHHSRAPQARDKNFAGFFSLWDVMFGTFYMPPGSWPSDFGVDERVPDGFIGQLAHPFRTGSARRASVQ